MALTSTPQAEFGSACPDFTLPSVDGRQFSKKDFVGTRAFLVMFICNHCPYVKAIEDRLLTLGRTYNPKDVGIVAICSNDSVRYPDDSAENLLKRWKEKSYPFPYLHDVDQKVAQTFGAVCTPDFFLYDKDMKLAYRGRLDDSWKDPQNVKRQEMKEAIDALVAGQRPSTEQQASMGCSIKWL